MFGNNQNNQNNQGYVNQYEQNILSGIQNRFFNTFSRQIVIYKQSQEIPIPNPASSQNFVFGLGNQQASTNYTYQQVTGVYSALVIYADDQKFEMLSDPNLRTTPGEVKIKVQEDAMNFIENGKTEKIFLDNRYFEIVGEQKQRTLLNNKLYQYILQSIK